MIDLHYILNIMFQRNHLDDLPYPIQPKDVALYEDRLETNINVFSFFDDEGKARYPMFISQEKSSSNCKFIILE